MECFYGYLWEYGLFFYLGLIFVIECMVEESKFIVWLMEINKKNFFSLFVVLKRSFINF